MHEPAPVVVDVHGPGFIVFPQHDVLEDVHTGHAKGRVWMVVIAVDGHLPVVKSFGEAGFAQDNSIIVAVAGDCQVVIGEDDVRVGRVGVK